MATFLSVHGYDPGPSQRPLLSGALSGILATSPAIPILIVFKSLRVEAAILGLSTLATLAIGCIAMAIAGALYARVFGRAANNVHGGWLFGMAFGFALWAAGAVLVLPVISGGRAPAGRAALGLATSLLVWGLATGILVPFVHRLFHESLEKAARHAHLGPSAAANQDQPIREQRRQNKG
jgi:small-conductance mechanosensitive channel